MGAKPTPVNGVPNLQAYEFDSKQEIREKINWFTEFGIPVGGVVVNMLIDETAVVESTPDFVKNRVAMQSDYMDEIWGKSNGEVRAIVPLFETEVRGVDMLYRTADSLFAWLERYGLIDICKFFVYLAE